jgi:hypothetical protein
MLHAVFLRPKTVLQYFVCIILEWEVDRHKLFKFTRFGFLHYRLRQVCL